MAANRSFRIKQYQVGIVCALPDEMSAAIATLDERHPPAMCQDKLDPNNYVLGRIHEHNVVVACLPSGVYGVTAAARVARDMLRTFVGLRFGLLVGIGGGIPNLLKHVDIRLGDVVISQPDKIYGGVVQYDLRKNLGHGAFERKGFLKPPPTMLLAALATLRADHNLDDSRVPKILADMITRHPRLVKNGYGFPGRENDTLQCPRCGDLGPLDSCDRCTNGMVARPVREDRHPLFWYGTIASGNELMKNAAERDRIGEEFDALCVEMEAAGLMNDFPCIVIRGICDYADSHKNDVWQKYAALTAAAYAKEFLGYISPEQTELEKPIQDVVASLDEHLAKQSRLVEEHLHEAKEEHEKQAQRYRNDQDRQCLRALKTSTYEQFKDVNPDRVVGTCQWVLFHPQYLDWHDRNHDNLLWISADPGCGKSVLAKSLVENELRTTDGHKVCYFFFKDNEQQDRLATALCALLHQLFSYQPRLIRYALPAWEKTGDKLIEEVAELWGILLAAARDDQMHDVTCILDALDECRLPDQRLLIDMLANFYTETSCSSSGTRRGQLKFLITSRPYDDIQVEFQKTLNDLPKIRLRGEEDNDQIHREIDLVIRMRVAQLATNLKLDSQIKDRLETTLLEMENRTYLWLYLTIEGIYETYRRSLRPKETVIDSLPLTVKDAYEKILSRVPPDCADTVKRILTIVVGARRPISIQEMAIALGIATSVKPTSVARAQLDPQWLASRIRDWCGLFVFINHNRIYLIHQTAKEFLIGGRSSASSVYGWKHCLDPRGIETEMTRICVEFLCLEDVWPTAQTIIQELPRYSRLDDIPEGDNQIQSLLVYSAEHWPSHLREANLSQDDPVIAKVLSLYQVDSKLYDTWFPIFWIATRPYSGPPRNMNQIRLAALLGHKAILTLTLRGREHADINDLDWEGWTALTWASEYGHETVFRMLVDAGADIHAISEISPNALDVASSRGHEKIVQILIELGVGIHASRQPFSTALNAALFSGHEKTVQILIAAGADIHAQTGGGRGDALYAASDGGQEKMVQMLLDSGADVNAHGGLFGNALNAALTYGHEKIVQILITAGANFHAQAGGSFRDALYAASYDGQEKMVQMLVDLGVDFNAQEE